MLFMKSNALKALVLGILILIVYSPVYNAGFVWDDKAVYENPHILSWTGISNIWCYPASMIPYEIHYWPLTHSSFWLENKIWGQDPGGYHRTNVLLHLLNTLLLWWFLTRIQLPWAWIAALIFGLHPVHAEPVCWILGRKDLLSFFFYLISVFSYYRFMTNRKRREILFSFIFFCLALLCKSIAVTLPGAILLINYYMRKFRVRDLIWPGLFSMTGLLYASLDISLCGSAEKLNFSLGIIERAIICGKSWWFYLGKLIYPADLIAVYPRWEASTNFFNILPFPAAISVMSILVVFRKRIPCLFGSFAFFTISLLPILGIIPFGFMRYSYVADRFQYLASAGIICGFTVLIHHILSDKDRIWRRISIVGLSFLMIAYCSITWTIAVSYGSKQSLFERVIARNPDAYIAFYNLGAVAANENKYAEAAEKFLTAYKIKPDHGDVVIQLGTNLMLSGQDREAEKYLNEATIKYPESVTSWINLGNVRLRLGNREQAILAYQQALKIDPENSLANNNLGFCMMKSGRISKAIDYLKTAIQTHPDSLEAHLNLARAWQEQQNSEKAVYHYNEVLRLSPNNVEALNNVAWILANPENNKNEIYREAARLAEKASQLTHFQDPGILDTLALAYHRLGWLSKSKTALNQAIDASLQNGNNTLSNQLRGKFSKWFEE